MGSNKWFQINGFKFNRLLEVNKRNQNNYSHINNFSEDRISLKEISNLNNYLESLIRDDRNSKLIIIKKKSLNSRIAKNENIRSNDDSLFNSKNFDKISKNYNYNNARISNFNKVDKKIDLEDFSHVNSCNTYSTYIKQSNEDRES
ncbi:hypothetical protein T552_00790 [Pneumocystis carinii B80]|uniref:Uncharacterized protein n=1 Tax=Pneumocystis carinii (strain B80) TaxID=1408658 RepID=A0A0W4ZPN2_PNEC8|nr:hypothetical protein T552_00790 [Pneumocystis carinii B80]KTW30317.1 hypothetical protein T552_00790 [Pneumocystis carinii B80]